MARFDGLTLPDEQSDVTNYSTRKGRALVGTQITEHIGICVGRTPSVARNEN